MSFRPCLVSPSKKSPTPKAEEIFAAKSTCLKSVSRCSPPIYSTHSIPHFGERLRVLLNQRLTGIYRLTNVLLRTENDFFS